MEKAKSFSIIFDISRSHGKNGRRNIDGLKKSLIEFVQRNFNNGLDRLYLYDPNSFQSFDLRGKQIGIIGNYETEGFSFNLFNALKHSLHVLKKEDEDFEKFLVLITDRSKDKNSIMKALDINNRSLIDSKFIFVGLGENYKDPEIESISFFHIDDPNQLTEVLENGKDISSQTDQ